MCKADYVLSVKVIISTSRRPRIPEAASLRIAHAFYAVLSSWRGSQAVSIHSKHIDLVLLWYIIDITYGLLQGRQRRQTQLSSATECPASRSLNRHGRTIPGQRLFRSRRFDPGQIRDATAGPGRTGPGQPGSARSRTLAALFLS